MLAVFEKDVEKVPQTFHYRANYSRDSITLADQEEALKEPSYAVLFASMVSGADIARCQEVACKDSYHAPRNAYDFALYVKGADITKCQEIACKHPRFAYLFALNIKGSNIKICQKAVKSTEYELFFKRYVPGAKQPKAQRLTNRRKKR